MGAQASPNLTIFQRLILLVKTLQFAWFIGHLYLILCVLRYTSLWIHLKCYDGTARFCYRTAFISAATTYGIAVYKILCFRTRTSQKVPGSALSIAAYETVQYLALALVWLFMPQRHSALLPYFIYSIFHVAVYIRSDLIPTIQANLIQDIRTLQTNVVSTIQTNVVSTIQTEIENNVVNPLQSKLQTNLNPLQTALQTNLNLELQATLKTIPVAPAAAALVPEMVPPSDFIADKISIFVNKCYDMSMSVLAPTMISFFVPQWIYPIFYLVTRFTALPVDTSGAKAPTLDSLADNIGVFIKTYYNISMSVVTGLEISIWFSLLFSAITLQRQSWIMIVVYTGFLRARYDLSDLAQLEAKVDGFLDAQNASLTGRQAWKSAMVLTHKFYHVSDLTKYMGGDSAPKKMKQR
ncbi:uncharacterized protein Z519_05302 [Cladophialophora bantiana CBS 173.52]|uniref:Uncharacterized protein n=1 Tax=Cladophialophora bantiana (strain ATCC 10958 / CBS 173.52 / CDC B-1940 / NIH 8579) TaxID=1442370 RepID=A0A0D2G5W6_CLAB1|nr:uncharacterized protein Z519_05302 [Cladophialophora bantiana CBS 173.52]KIW93987.1 hypothetical protein Z519_05302 [Cladophialophora bantiana CBS 173.52]